MRVFVTGATGFVGSAVVPELIRAGHQVVGLSRSDANAKALADMGAETHPGDLQDLDALRSGAAAADGVIHAGFIHDFSKYQENSDIDAAAIAAIGEVLEGTEKPLVVTSGIAQLAPGRVATEDDRRVGDGGRMSEAAAEALAARGIRASSIRLSPTVHGAGDHGFVPMVIGTARTTGVSAYVGDGQNRWPGVHRLDAARLYRLALEKGATNAHYHGVAEEGVTVREIAEMIGRRLNLPVVSKPPEEAMAHFGFLGMFLASDIPASSAKTQAELGWRPTELGLIADLDQNYFET